METANQEYINSEISRVSTLVCELSEEYFNLYTHINEHVKIYVYGPSVAAQRGYYSPSPVHHLAIGGSQKGPKPKADMSGIKSGEIFVYGLDEKDRPIYIYTMLSPGRMASEYEIVSYSTDRVLGITFDEFGPSGIHETQFSNNRVKSITTCYYNYRKPPTLENCREMIMEQFDYDKTNHFFWRLLNYNQPIKLADIPEALQSMFKGLSLQLNPIRDLTYEFETNEKGIVIKMYGDGFEKSFNNKKTKAKREVISSNTPPKKSQMVFQKMVDEAAIDNDHFNFDEFTKLIKAFMLIRFDCAEDDLLFETGVFDSIYGEDTFTVSFVRQFSINDKNDVYEHMEQLHIVLSYENKNAMKNLQCAEWYFNDSTLDDFFDKIKTLQVYDCLKNIKSIKSLSINHTLV